MSKTVKLVNKFFKDATRNEIEEVKSEIVLSDRQATIFTMYYEQRKDVNFIADTICVCDMVVNIELKNIRKKLMRVWEKQKDELNHRNND